jgi:hypothetical protein
MKCGAFIRSLSTTRSLIAPSPTIALLRKPASPSTENSFQGSSTDELAFSARDESIDSLFGGF